MLTRAPVIGFRTLNDICKDPSQITHAGWTCYLGDTCQPPAGMFLHERGGQTGVHRVSPARRSPPSPARTRLASTGLQPSLSPPVCRFWILSFTSEFFSNSCRSLAIYSRFTVTSFPRSFYLSGRCDPGLWHSGRGEREEDRAPQSRDFCLIAPDSAFTFRHQLLRLRPQGPDSDGASPQDVSSFLFG